VPTITHVFNFGLPMKAEDYTHRIGRTGRAGRDGLAITFAEFRDRRKIFDIEAYTRQQFKAEVVPGLEPQQRMPDSRPRTGGFGGGAGGQRDYGPRDRKFGGQGRGAPEHRGFDRKGGGHGHGGGFGGGNGGGNGGGFDAPRGDRFAPRGDSFAPRGENFAPRGDSFTPRGDNFAPRGDAPRGNPFAKPVRSAPGPKVFVPRDAVAKRRSPKPVR
jgi:hypothetical protein